LFIVWEKWEDNVETHIMKFKYGEFIEAYNNSFNAIKDIYQTHFECGLYDED